MDHFNQYNHVLQLTSWKEKGTFFIYNNVALEIFRAKKICKSER